MIRLISCIFMLLLGFYSLSWSATEPSTTSVNTPEFIPVTKKPCYIGCDYQFQYCYHYNILNMNDAIKVKEWNVSGGFVTGKAVADIKAKLMVKACYQLSLAAAIPVVDKEIDLTSEFEFRIKVNGDSGDMCISDEESTINFSTLELRGDLKPDPIPLMQAHLQDYMSSILKESVINAVHNSLAMDKGSEKAYCGEGETDTEETDAPCGCE
jgi:hypothetical protein